MTARGFNSRLRNRVTHGRVRRHEGGGETEFDGGSCAGERSSAASTIEDHKTVESHAKNAEAAGHAGVWRTLAGGDPEHHFYAVAQSFGGGGLMGAIWPLM